MLNVYKLIHAVGATIFFITVPNFAFHIRALDFTSLMILDLAGHN